MRQPPQNGSSTPVGIPKNQQKYIENILSRLLKTREAEPFRDPVDPVAHNVPDYLNVIQEPMDLGTIDRRLRQRGIKPGLPYTNIDEVVRDVRLVFKNCYTYNGDTHPVSALASKVSDIFENAMAALPAVEVSCISSLNSGQITDKISPLCMVFLCTAFDSSSDVAPKLYICLGRHTAIHFISWSCCGVSRSCTTWSSSCTCASATR